MQLFTARKNISSLIAVFFVLAGLILSAGCGQKQETPTSGQLSATGGGNTGSTQTSSPGTPDAAGSDTLRLTIYYATKDGEALAPEIKVVPKTDHPVQAALEALLAGPASHDLVNVFPAGVKVRGVWVKDHTAFVDFNDKVRAAAGSTTELLLVGAVVDTLTEFPDIHLVQFLVEGKKTETLSGHVDVSEPLGRSESLIRKNGR